MKLLDLINKDISLFKKSNTETKNISTMEAFNIFDILRVKYNSIETLKFYLNFIHDRDCSLLINNILGNYHKHLDKLVHLSKKHKVKVPPLPAHNIKISMQLEQLTDKFIYKKLYGDLVYELYSLDRGITSSTFNDQIRNVLVDFTLAHLQDFNSLYKYGKVKGWLEITPNYKIHKAMDKEQINIIEASHIWDLLNSRYDNVHLTDIFLQFVHDFEFKEVLELGKIVLFEQIKVLEEQAEEYQIPTPEQPPVINEIDIDPEIMEDQFAYRIVLKGIQEALSGHIRAIIESITNDQLRKIFLNFFKTEITVYNKFLKYGKMKGWTHVPPLYRQM